jgi:integrase
LSALDALALRLDGKTAGATTINRKRAVLHSVLEYAVQLGDLDSNPLHKIKWTPPKTSETVDPRVVVNPAQAASLLVAVTYVGQRGRGKRLMAFFACMYYAAMRPAEVIGLRSQDCWLPPAGWGKITLAKSRPEVNRKWTDSGDAHEERGLKHRADDDVRPVPIPPILVKILRTHIKEHGVGPDGRIFRSERGKPVASTASTAYTEVWQEARLLAFTPEHAASPLAGRLYDLRLCGRLGYAPRRGVSAAGGGGTRVAVRIILGWGQCPSESSQPGRDESRVQSGRVSGVSGS